MRSSWSAFGGVAGRAVLFPKNDFELSVAAVFVLVAPNENIGLDAAEGVDAGAGAPTNKVEGFSTGGVAEVELNLNFDGES